MSYQQILSFSESMKKQIYTCRMPLIGEEPLSAADRATLFGWLVCGANND